MTTLAYLLVGVDGQEAMPRLQVFGGAHHDIQWFADMAPMASVAAFERSGFVELLKLARKGDALVVSSISHLGSSAVELIKVLQTLESTGVTVISLR